MRKLISLASLLLTVAIVAQPTLPGVDDALKQAISQSEISGGVAVVATADKVVHLSAVGEAVLASHTPIKTDSIFWIASMTKPITGAAVLMLQDEGKLNINDPVAKYIPEFANIKTPSGQSANLTIKHLMTHTSGLAENTPDQVKAAKTLADLIPGFTAKATNFEPGAKWAYCQSGINSLGRIVEVASGQPFAQFVQKRLFEPLAMKDTTFYPSKDQQARIAKSYKKNKETGKLEDATIFIFAGRNLEEGDRTPLPNGGLFSTGPDYTRFCQMILNNGTLDGKQYLKPESVKLLTTVQSGDLKTGFTPGNGWGLTFCVIRDPQGVTAMLSPGTHGHGGAYGTQAWIDPVKGRIFVLMVQRAGFPNADGSDVRKAFQQAAVDALGK